MAPKEAKRRLRAALDDLYERLERERVPYAATIADAATAAAMQAQLQTIKEKGAADG